MARTVTLAQLRTDIAAQCDFSTSTSGRYTPTLLNRLINQSIQRFRERISDAGATHYLVATSGVLPPGVTAPYGFQVLDLTSLNPAIVRLYGVDINVGGVNRTLPHRTFIERNEYTTSPTMTNQPAAWAAFQDGKVAIMPGPDTAYPYTVWYLPLLADLSSDSDTFDGVAGWEIWVLWDCVCQLIARDQYQAAYQQAVMERDNAWADVNRVATRVTSAGGAVVGRDSMGGAPYMLRQSRRVTGQTGGSPLPASASITNAMLVQRTGPVVLGRREATTGAVEDLTNADLPLGAGTEIGQSETWTGSIWIPFRNAIIPQIDLTGATEAWPTLLATLQAARQGAWIYIPDGIVKLGSTAGTTTLFESSTWPEGVSITGKEVGANMGHRVYNNGVTQVGTRLDIYSTGVVFKPRQQSLVSDFTVYYPNQQTNAAPDTYDYLFWMDDGNHGASVQRICAINPFRLLHCNVAPGTIRELRGNPLSRGITLLRVADVARIEDCHFGNVDWATGATLTAWKQANGRAFSVDGAEEFKFTGCFAYGYHQGLAFEDEDGDSFRGCYGDMIGCGFDSCDSCFIVLEPNGLTLRGLKIYGGAFIPAAGGACFSFADTHTPSNPDQRPTISADGFSVHGSHTRTIQMLSGSYGRMLVEDARFQSYTNEGVYNFSSTANVELHNVGMITTGGTNRVNPASVGVVKDLDGWEIA